MIAAIDGAAHNYLLKYKVTDYRDEGITKEKVKRSAVPAERELKWNTKHYYKAPIVPIKINSFCNFTPASNPPSTCLPATLVTRKPFFIQKHNGKPVQELAASTANLVRESTWQQRRRQHHGHNHRPAGSCQVQVWSPQHLVSQ
jgi:hypothetical protein